METSYEIDRTQKLLLRRFKVDIMVETPLLAGGIGTGIILGGAFGIRHAFEADHIAAVATLVEDEQHPASTGAAWGVGHSLPILILGALVLALNLQIPPSITAAFELLVAVILIVLGLRVLAGREGFGIAILRHIHGNRDDANRGHRHVTVGNTQIGLRHSHRDEESLTVGVIHGLAGSGGVVVALTAASPTVTSGASFLIGFSLASILAMSVISWVWGRALGQAHRLRILAGMASIMVGLLLLVETAGYTPTV